MKTLWEDFREGRKRIAAGREGSSAAKRYRRMIEEKDKLWDVSTADPERKKKLEEEWGVQMGPREVEYLEDQRGPRLYQCDHGVDPVYYRAIMRKRRQKEREEEHVRLRREAFLGKTMEDIEAFLETHGDFEEPMIYSPAPSDGSPAAASTVASAAPRQVKRRLFVAEEDEDEDPLPPEFRHIRDSERKVRDTFYTTCANLSGEGLSLQEASSAVIVVGNGMFGRSWKKSQANDGMFDRDTAPEPTNILDKMRQIEAQSLSLIVKEVQEGKASGRMITHASDSTTRRGVGKFIGQGLHIGQESAFTLPLLGISGETKEDTAQQMAMGLEILSAVSGVPVKELMEQVDTLLTDSAEHNKGVNVILQEMYDLNKPAGQLFCGVHTTLGFSSAMNKVVKKIEEKMKLEEVVAKFMVELDTKNCSLAGQALDMMLRLVAPEYRHKPWNCYEAFCLHLQKNQAEQTLFAYKDHRFGCLSRAAAVLLYNLDHINAYLAANPQVNNKLACLVRELLNIPHLSVVFVAFALLGVHLVEPFYARTIASGATHTDLQVFYQGLYNGLRNSKVDRTFILLDTPAFPGVSEDLFAAVKESYGQAVLQSVVEKALEVEEDALLLINMMLPELATTLARQRRDYSLDEAAFPAEFPVGEQAATLDDTPVNNMDMERLMGKADQRLHKLQSLPAASRSIILKRTQALRETHEGPSFRSFKEAVQLKREKELEWNKQQDVRFRDDATRKQHAALAQERKRLAMLESLKAKGGPFTNSDEVAQFLEGKLPEKEKQARMKKEVQFARDSSITLPRTNSLFKIQVSACAGGKRRDKTSHEFGDALKTYLGWKTDRQYAHYETFRDCLKEMALAVSGETA